MRKKKLKKQLRKTKETKNKEETSNEELQEGNEDMPRRIEV